MMKTLTKLTWQLARCLRPYTNLISLPYGRVIWPIRSVSHGRTSSKSRIPGNFPASILISTLSSRMKTQSVARRGNLSMRNLAYCRVERVIGRCPTATTAPATQWGSRGINFVGHDVGEPKVELQLNFWLSTIEKFSNQDENKTRGKIQNWIGLLEIRRCSGINQFRFEDIV